MATPIRDILESSSLYELARTDNLVAVVPPTVNDDETLGYSVRSVWLDNNIGNLYFCADATTGAAVWTKVTASTQGIDNYTAIVDPTVNDDETLSYDLGSTWYNTVSGEVYKCVDATTGAAVWLLATLTLDDLGSAATYDVGTDGGQLPTNDDLDAANVDFTPDNGANWTDPDPIQVKGALDALAARVILNDAKVTNATHTGEVTGSSTLTLDKSAIQNKTQTNPALDDFMLFSDTSDSQNLKKASFQNAMGVLGLNFGTGYAFADNFIVPQSNGADIFFQVSSITIPDIQPAGYYYAEFTGALNNSNVNGETEIWYEWYVPTSPGSSRSAFEYHNVYKVSDYKGLHRAFRFEKPLDGIGDFVAFKVYIRCVGAVGTSTVKNVMSQVWRIT